MIYSLGDRTPVFEGKHHFIAPGARIIGNVRLKAETSIWFNCVLRGDNDWIEVGDRSNVQDGSVLHTDPGYPLIVGRGVTIGHKVMLHGCTIDANSLVGIGSTILNGAVIGSNCIVGANSLVTENKAFADSSLIMGSPARAVRGLSDEEIASIAKSADHYVVNAKRYRQDLRS